ncbi:MAG TPA: helix-turn-helix transcriptional regulator [Thermomicrobiales bacterium]|nr:helix-turn-helix transcriptional regulator [Thermomicrobiales bacterium]
MGEPPGELAALVRQAREARGWSQLGLAIEADVAPATVARLEAGRARRPTGATLGRLAAALGLPLDDLAAAATRDAAGRGR